MVDQYAHHDDLLAVATAHRQALIAGAGEEGGFQAALDAFLKCHPKVPLDEAGDEVNQLIAQAIDEYGEWLYGDE